MFRNLFDFHKLFYVCVRCFKTYSFSISSGDKPVHSATISIEIFLSIILFAVSMAFCCAPCDSPIEMPYFIPSSRASLFAFFYDFLQGIVLFCRRQPKPLYLCSLLEISISYYQIFFVY